jgi:hypothetical protein
MLNLDHQVHDLQQAFRNIELVHHQYQLYLNQNELDIDD